MSQGTKKDLSQYIKTVYTAENAIPLGSRVCVPNDNTDQQLKKLLGELKELKKNGDPEEVFQWIDKTIHSLEKSPSLNKLINKVKSS